MTTRGKMIFITGAARSGKSYWAEKMASARGKKVIYIATCVPGDEEMKKRVDLHKSRRPAEWQTVEEPLEPAGIIKNFDQPGYIILLDCMTLLLTNWMLHSDQATEEEPILDKISELALVSHDAAADVIIVSNEVGGGIVPADPLSRQFRDILGRANQIMASSADKAYVTIAGIPVEIKALAEGVPW